MLLQRAVLDRIVAGDVTIVFRRWTKPTVKQGGRLRTVVGELSIDTVHIVQPSEISEADARAAGFESTGSLLDDLFTERPSSGRGRVTRASGAREIFRIGVSFAGADTRIALRSAEALSEEELTVITSKLDRFDGRASTGPWTRQTLELIEHWPGRRAPELAELCNRETIPFKNDVRKLKELGLTESLTVGYQLSPRGKVVIAAIRTS
jgi:hypothetical protein